MSKIHGKISLHKRIREHPVWNADPACYGRAFADLLLLANDAPRVTMMKGEPVHLKRGQLAWSIRGLEKEWSRSAEWITSFLNFCRDNSMITVESKKNRGTIITILNYDAYNPPLPDTVSDTEPSRVPDTVSDTEPEWNGEEGKGTGNGEEKPPKNAVSMDAAVERFAGLASGYSDAEIRAAWHELTAGAVAGCWVTGRPLRPVADWRSALESELWKRRQIFGEKNSARPAESRRADEVPVPLKNSALTLEAMRGDVK